MENAAANGRSEDERWHVRKDGTERWISGVLTALRDPAGELRGFAKVMRDSTAQRAATLEREELLQREFRSRQQAEEANRTKDAFLATLSHELRTPLNAMLGWTRMLATGQLADAQIPRAITIVERNAQVQAQLVAELLDVSRISTGKLQLQLQSVAIDQVIETAVESLRHVALAKDIVITTRLGEGESEVSASIDGDPDRLQQVMFNVLSNAIKFTPPRGTIDVELATRADDAEITVRDSGKGIAPELLPRIFDQFQQGERGEAPTSGLGLGLAIARHIIELHRGTIEARSDGHGQGATFIVRLPRTTGTALAPSSIVEPAVVKHPANLRGKTALIVGDAHEDRRLTAHVLQSCGMRVLTADSVPAAAAILNVESVDVIVTELRMSGESDGLDFIRDLRDDTTPGARVPAVAVTDKGELDDRARALISGYDLHIESPINPSHLIDAVSAVLQVTPE
jgi:signal transduction histidine kinase